MNSKGPYIGCHDNFIFSYIFQSASTRSTTILMNVRNRFWQANRLNQGNKCSKRRNDFPSSPEHMEIQKCIKTPNNQKAWQKSIK